MDVHTFHGFVDEMSKQASLGRILSRAGSSVANSVRSAGRSLAHIPKQTVHGFTGHTFGSPTLQGIGMDDVPAKVRAMGLTSIPGVAKSLVRRPVETVKELAGGSKANLAWNVGLPVAAYAPSLVNGDESAQGGASMGQKLTNMGVGVGAGVLTSRLPFIPNMVASGLAMYGADRLARPRTEETP